MDPQPGTNAGPQQSTAQQKPLSCTNCRARKLKCSREHPCQHCTRSGAECVFPTRKRIRKPRKNKNSDLLQRLSRLESIVGKVGIANLADEAGTGENAGAEHGSEGPASTLNSLTANLSLSQSGSRPTLEGPLARAVGSETQSGNWQSPLLDSKASEYLSGEFWTSLCGEVEGLRQALEQSTDSDDDEQLQEATPDSTANYNSPPAGSSLSPGMLLGNSSSITYEVIQHPTADHIYFLTSAFFTNVDMILKILHQPTIQAALGALAESPELARSQLTPEKEALFFSIYHAAVASLSAQTCLARLGQRREDLIRMYAAAVEHLLVRADYLNNTSLETLQALTLYAACLRSTSGSRASWALLALPIRLAQALSLHRESSNTRLPPYEVELRRRLWWQLIVLDIRASEDRGTTSIIAHDSYDTSLPLNLNDADFGPNSMSPLIEKQGPTDVTFSLCTAQCSGIFHYAEHAQGASLSSDDTGCRGDAAGGRVSRSAPSPPQSVEETVRYAQSLEAQFVAGADPSHPPSYLASVTVRLIILKLWLTLQYPLHPRRRPHLTTSLPPPFTPRHPSQPQAQAQNQGIFPQEATLRTAVSIMELTVFLQTGQYGDRFRWWANTYVQWHPLAVALAELCAQTKGELVDRAWGIIEDVFPKWSEVIADTKSGTLWRPIRKLYKKAKAARAATGLTPTAFTAAMAAAAATTSASATTAVPPISTITSTTTTRDSTAAEAGTIHVNTQDLEGSNNAMETESAYGMETGKARDRSVPPDLGMLSTSPYSFSQSMWAWKDLSFDIPPLDISGSSNVMDWSTWDDFVQDTQDDADRRSKSGSDVVSPQ
ncbi:fungal-specific transcription factor domain-containing protein [Hypoxylon sp. NC1633]|nr:fungal-specific transcription factor domain-containing protein [Hypoxylon sp. NC1633]